MLPELLSERSRAETVARFDGLAEHASRVYPLFARHQKGNPRNRGDLGTGLPVYWEHAEEFLDFVDTAANGNSARKSILAKETNGTSVEALRDSCVRVVAAECEITSLVDLSSENAVPEVWQPYLRWFRGIKRTDALVTFNYDLVLEKLGEAAGTSQAPGAATVFGVEGYVGSDGAAPIYKLHGSIDWVRPTLDGAPFGRNPDPRSQILLTPPPLIATPGPSKKSHCTTVFDSVWKQALEMLRRAAVVVFVGYRFPPSDSESRTKLLGALRENTNPGVRVHTVLGPHTTDGDTIRLRELLRSTLSERLVELPESRTTPSRGHFQVVVHPLYAEDFFTVIHENLLFGHSMT